MMTRTRSQGKAKSRVSFNPVVHEKPLENGLSDDDEVEEEVEEVEEDEVAKELEMESASADETDEDETLTAQEARSLSGQFKQMKRAQDTGFQKGDIILVRPNGLPRTINDPELLWKARVVRAKKDKAGKIYIEIRWFYSAEQTVPLRLPAKTQFLPQRVCGKHEIIETTHGDILSKDSFVSRLDVYQLTDNPEQEEIDKNAWYTRASYSLNTKKFKVLTAPCFLCHNHYRPESGEEKDEQAYCPTCHKWYHHVCLVKKEQQIFQDDLEQDLTKLLARNLPEPPSEPAAKRRRRDTGPKSKTSPVRRGPPGAELRAQKNLRKIAGTRIVRGGSYGLTGIVKQICTARRILSELESGVMPALIGTDWDKEIGLQLVKEAKHWPDSAAFCYSCPRCSGAI